MRLVPMLVAATAAAPAAAQDVSKSLPGWAPGAAQRICEAYRSEPLSLERLVALLGQPVTDQSFEREHDQQMRARLVLANGDVVTVIASLYGTEKQRIVLIGASRRHAEERLTPVFDVSLAPDCSLALAEALAFDEAGKPDRILRFSGPNLAQEQIEPLNPPVPPGADPGGVRVAQVDTGVAYDRPEIASRLARDASGRILGWDFRDDDDRPYDRDPGQALLFARQHGTGTASVLLTEAKEASLIPFRHPGNNPEALGRIPDEAAKRGARIVTMSLGTSKPELWKPFAEAARRHPEILFVVSAGNDGRDIDADPVYPAALRLDNMVVVTSAEPDGRIARGSNWGARNVDLAVPAERIPILSPSGAKVLGSGPSYAAPRVAALAARLLAKNPALTTDKLKVAILAYVKPMPKGEPRMVRVGWIPDPTAAP